MKMNKVFKSYKSQIIFIYIPILLSIFWGLISNYFNLDDKNIDIIFAVYPLIGLVNIFYLLYFRKDNNPLFLFLGVLTLFTLMILVIYDLLPVNKNDTISILLIIFYTTFFIMSLILHFLQENKKTDYIKKVYNFLLLTLLPLSFMGYILVFVLFSKVIYSFF